jgi:hypothetical protein
MLTNQVDTETFIIQDQTFSAGDVIPLTGHEEGELKLYYNLTTKLEEQRMTMFENMHTISSNADQALAKEFYAYDADRIRSQYMITSLIRKICTRLGGMLPLGINLSNQGDPMLVVQSLAGTKSSVVLTVDSIRQATGFSQFIGDVRSFGALLLSNSLIKGLTLLDKIEPTKWNLLGCPYLVVKNPPLSAAYASEHMEFKWADHEGQSLDQGISKALSSLLSIPGRFAAMQSGTQPLAFIAGVLSEDSLVLLNLSATTKPGDEFRLGLLKSVAGNATAVFLLQFGPLRRDGSTHDFSEDLAPSQTIMGISFTLVLKTASGPILGSKSWSFVKDDQGEPALKVFGLFENTAGLSANSATDLLKNLLAEPVSV